MSAPESARSRLDLPALVYPTSAALGRSRRPCRWLARWLATSSRRRFRLEILRRITRRSVSSCVSPGPRSPMPPRMRERWVHIRVRRGSRYSSCASSTCIFASAERARVAKMSRITSVRSITRTASAFSRLGPCTGDSASSNNSSVAPVSWSTPFSSSTFPCPRYNVGVGASTRWWVRPTTSAPAVSASRPSSSRWSSTCATSTEPLRGAPTRNARSTGGWMSISCRIGSDSSSSCSSNLFQQLHKRDVPRARQSHRLRPQRGIEEHPSRHAVGEGPSREQRLRARPDAGPREPHGDDHPVVIGGRQVERPVQQRVAEVRALEIDAHFESRRAQPVVVRVPHVEHEIERAAGEPDAGDVDLLKRDIGLGEREAAEGGAGGCQEQGGQGGGRGGGLRRATPRG